MNQMMEQMNAMMQMMQRNGVVAPEPVPPINQMTNDTPITQPIESTPQTSGAQSRQEGK